MRILIIIIISRSPLYKAIMFDDKDIRTLNVRWLRAQMALVQQEPVLFAGTVRDNIAYGKEGASDSDLVVQMIENPYFGNSGFLKHK